MRLVGLHLSAAGICLSPWLGCLVCKSILTDMELFGNSLCFDVFWFANDGFSFNHIFVLLIWFVSPVASSDRNLASEDDVFFLTVKFVDFARGSGGNQDTGGVLEGCRTQEGVGAQASLGN